MAKSPYQRIVRAAARDAGLRLSAEEVKRMNSWTPIRELAAIADEVEIANQCTKCLHYVIPHAEGWHCASHEEPPVGRCGDWKGAE